MSELFYSLSTEHATKRSIFGARCIVYKKNSPYFKNTKNSC